MKIRARVVVSLVIAFFSIVQPGFSQLLTPERAADIAVRDAKETAGLENNLKLFLGKVDRTPGLLRLEILSSEDPSLVPGKPFATYEFDTRARRIVRRDFTPAGEGILFDRDEPASGSENLRTGIHGVLRNLPGYILETSGFISRFLIWAEAGGRVVASETELVGTTVYHLKNIPSNVGSVAIKAKIRGYDLTVLHPGVAINASQPAGTIGGVDIDFSTLSPIYRTVRVVVRSTQPSGDSPGSFPNGARARVYIRETGHSVDVVSQNGWAEATFSNVPTGWPLNFFAINLDQGYHSGQTGPVTILEDGGTSYTLSIQID